MELYSETKEFKLYHGSMLDMLSVIKPKSIDSIVTDPPYELNFMGKGWDNSGIAFQKATWEKCFQVLKPGGYLLAFGGTRTFHRIACAIEDAGFEIRDTIMWLYGNGFPKSMNLGKAIESKVDCQTDEAKQWVGWGTTLKPAYEPVIVARKPCEGSCVDNVMRYGVGGINIDECRIDHNEPQKYTNRHSRTNNVFNNETCGFDSENNHTASANPNGRYPSNVILTYDDSDVDEVCGGMPDTKSTFSMPNYEKSNCNATVNIINGGAHKSGFHFDDEGSAARYYYCAKASKRDRDEGLDAFKAQQKYYCDGRGNSLEIFGSTDGGRKPLKNIHPTVKPVDLMQYLVRLVTPKNGIVLDPFNGSGSTGKAVMYENKDRQANYKYIGIELSAEYLPIAEARIRFAANNNVPIEVPETPIAGQITFDDLIENISKGEN